MKTVHNIHMKPSLRLVALGLVLTFGAGQEAWAAQQQEEDSVYRWGRWAVLSPAAGGDSYEGQITPDAANNATPGIASPFTPEVASIGTPPVPPVQPPIEPPVTNDPRDRLPPLPPPVTNDPRDRLPPLPPPASP